MMSWSQLSSDRRYESKRNTPISLSSIKYDSIYILLELPYSLAYSNCAPTLDPLTINRKKSQKNRDIKVSVADVISIGVLLGQKGKMQQMVIF